MLSLKKLVAAASLAVVASAGASQAAPITGNFHVVIYVGTGGGSINDPTQQANQSNPLIAPGNILTQGLYNGTINWVENSTNDIGAFLLSSGGTYTPDAGFGTGSGTVLSAPGFSTVSVFVITGDTFGSTLAGTISHDDGASLYDGPGYANTVAASALPTSDISTNYSGLNGPFELIYVEANGLPADLTMDVTSSVPEPLTISLFGAGLVGAGAFYRRRKAAKKTS